MLRRASAAAFHEQADAMRLTKAWKVLEWRFGATDTEVDLCLEKYGFPRAILH